MNPHKWKPNDRITAERLNSMTDSILCIQAGMDIVKAAAPTADTGISTSSANWGGGYDSDHREQHRWTNQVKWRHPQWGTGDLSADEEVGFYGSEIAVTKADGTLVNDVVNVGVLSQQVAGDSGSTLYAMLTTDEKGNIAGTPELVQGLPSCTKLFGLKRGEGSLYFPIAKLADNPKFRAEKIAMNYNPITLPLIADDASYNPCMEGGNAAMQREIEGMSWVDEIDGSIIPIRGMNNHGGLKVLACDTDGCSRKSNAVKVSVEMYGVENPAGSSEETTTPIEYCGTEYRIFQDSYNHSKPYKDGGDGKLASWPIIAAGTRMVGEISLMGGHFDDWQLWFRGEGQIELPENCYTDWTVGTETAEDFRYAFEAADIPVEVAGTQIEHKGIIVKEYQREEKFGYTCETDDEGNAVSKKILQCHTEWKLVGTKFVDLGGKSENYDVSPDCSDNYRYEFTVGSGALSITEYKRDEKFGQNGNLLYHEHSEWSCNNTFEIPLSANCVPEQTEYEFDPEFFAVTETGNGARRVSLKMSRINSMVDEVVNELEVQVNVTGIIECTADGTLRVANTTTAGRLTDSTHVDSFISY